MSKDKYFSDSNYDPLDQLNLLKEKCNNISPHLYRVTSTYLEEIRDFLPQTIRTSLLFLITNKPGEAFGFSTISSRKIFQLVIDKLVSESMSLITIEHLSELAKKITEENISNLNNAKDELSNSLNLKNDSEKSESFASVNSINISLIPPLENLSITEGWSGDLEAPYTIDSKKPYIKSEKSVSEYLIKNKNKNYETLEDDSKNSDTFNLKRKDIEVLQSIFSLTDEASPIDLDPNTEGSSNEFSSCEDVMNNRFLPQSPIGLYEWIISIDSALVRRLRDLSDSINSELLKSGLVNTLVPINILDAALAGQLISTKSISNILSFKLPTNNPFASSGLDIDCLLITPSDMEFDNPRLRKNRANIKYYQNVILGMIKQQHYWQGRSLADEVNKEWWKDTTKI